MSFFRKGSQAIHAYSKWGRMKDVYNFRSVSDEEYLRYIIQISLLVLLQILEISDDHIKSLFGSF